MILLGHFLISVGGLLSSVATILIFLMFARAILSWVSPDPSNFIVRLIYSTTEPLLMPVREKIPPLGMFDMSLFVVVLGLYFVDNFIAASMVSYGSVCLSQGTTVVGG